MCCSQCFASVRSLYLSWPFAGEGVMNASHAVVNSVLDEPSFESGRFIAGACDETIKCEVKSMQSKLSELSC
jgi:hypothetical protein